MPEGTFEAVIGLEVHVQLATATKMFCRCAYRYGAPPNSQTCPVCLGYPGALPVPNARAVDLAVLLALAVGATVHERSAFARKSYFYPDLPKGYQITQYEHPLATGGELPIGGVGSPGGSIRAVRLERLHLEEDAGKLIHRPDETLIDFNRSGVPLVEIVTRPDLRSPEEARELLQTLRRLLRYLGVSDASMEEGSLRADANVSVRRPGEELGTKVEVKNLNSFRHVARALEHEIERQGEVLATGGRVVAETRSFDAATGETRALRTKEEQADYRYFPEPDLPPLAVGAARRAALAQSMPERPWERRDRLVAEHALPPEDAAVLTDSRELADYFERALAAAGALEADARPRAKALGDRVRTEILRELADRGQEPAELAERFPPEDLAELEALVVRGALSHGAAREVLGTVWGTGESPAAAVERLGLTRIDDRERIARWVDEVLDAHPEKVERYAEGKRGLLGFFVGEVMRRSDGRADPHRVRELLTETIHRRFVSTP